MTPKNQRGTLTLAIFRMLNFDDFISYSSYTKIYMKNMGGSARNSIDEKLPILGSKGPHPLGVSFFRWLNFFLIVFFVMRTPYGLRISS